MDVVQNSVAQSLEADPLVKEVIQVVATCFNANGDLGAIANRTVARLQVSVMEEAGQSIVQGVFLNFLYSGWLCRHVPRVFLLCAYNATPYCA